MKVRLSKQTTGDGMDIHSLSRGCEYVVLGIEADGYRILDSKGEPILFDASCFEITDPREPDFWVSTFGDEYERYSYPPGWGVPGFFEGWHDHDNVIRQIFSTQLSYWCPDASRQPK